MRAASIKVRNEEVLINLDTLVSAIKDVPDMLAVIGAYMLGSVARTFRDQGSPAGVWPELAESTKKKKGYTAGHKLLIMSGLLFGSIKYKVSGRSVTIGTPLKYGPVHQYGSLDRMGGSIGAQAKIDGRSVHVDDFRRMRTLQKENKKKGERRIRVEQKVSGHDRHQNIPARPYLVFRPEDPSNIELAVAGYVRKKAPNALSGSMRGARNNSIMNGVTS
jgi:phage virion morphogenesis protein